MSRAALLNMLSRQEYVSEDLHEAFERVDRADFVPEDARNQAYEDRPLAIGEGQTISQPRVVAFMLSLLDVEPGQEVLDIGCGSGYTTALLARMVDDGFVKGVELRDALVEFGKENLRGYDTGNVEISRAERGVLGDPGNRYDRILVSAAAESFPDELLDQGKDHSVIVIPVGAEIRRVEKRGDEVSVERHQGFRFVPLVGYQDGSL